MNIYNQYLIYKPIKCSLRLIYHISISIASISSVSILIKLSGTIECEHLHRLHY